MDRSIPLLLIGLVFGGGIGFTIAAGNGITFDGHDHGDPGQHGGSTAQHADATSGNGSGHGSGHNHDEMVSVADDGAAPTLTLAVHKDPAAGWNLNIQTENFRFAPENASTAHVEGEGHAHVYINGVKLGRYYADWLHLSALPKGQVEVKVTLNSNDHKMLAVGATPLSQTLTIEN
ncbi:hypothetical protein QEZ52_18180 [Aliisedimentitalea scapharcae]|uniref:Uncharacterized protein n=1 Tax=Aliisedimentitalea scapharcae TaxID=1524259 RepID=A0ABZ2XT28_9RHOB